jgi:hypothetical protein
MFRKIAIALLLVGVASPVRALTPQESYQYGAKAGLLICNSFDLGAENSREMMISVMSSMTKKEQDIMVFVHDIKEAVGNDDPVVAAYNQGSQDATDKNCREEMTKLLESN